ncbi:MAG TPA: glycerol-3-phosphate dehydrogenase C-terminal domain-containing protein, partial [Candidatus Synoicihabitans sp.]|nr:glycerol-3-phosphate dehydrogenase C-terminal domain-containing protein [Candidatus Synoicihabitans sp.]
SPALRERLGASSVIRAQVCHAMRAELAVTLADVVFRRTELASGHYPGQTALQDCARLMAQELGWSARRTEDELSSVAARFPASAVKQVMPAEADLL